MNDGSGFTDRGVVILGGSGGVGVEAACGFAEHGARGVVLLGRNAERGAQACDTVRSRVPDAPVSFVAVDATDPAQVETAVLEVERSLGRIDVLVTTSGPTETPRLLHRFTLDEMSPVLDAIVLPPILMMGAVLPAMRARGDGVIVAVASDAAKVATPGESLIGAGMAAISMFCRTAAVEAKREGVRINVVTPSIIAESTGSAILFADPFSTKLWDRCASQADLGVVNTRDVADTILFLAGTAAKRITGQVVSVNGGISVA